MASFGVDNGCVMWYINYGVNDMKTPYINKLKKNIVEFRNSINSKFLLVYIAIVLLCMTLFTGITYYYSYITLNGMAQQNVNQIILSMNDLLSTYVDDIKYEMFTLQANKDVQSILTAPKDVSSDVKKLDEILSGIDPFKKRIISAELYSFNPDYPSLAESSCVFSARELENDPWFRDVCESGTDIVWNIFDYPDATYISASKQIINTATKEPVAVVRFFVDVNYFNNILRDIRLAKTGRVFLTTDSHIINPEQVPLINAISNNTTLFGKMLKDKKSNCYTSINGERCYMSSNALRDTGLFLVGCVKVREFGDSRAILNRTYIGLLILMIIMIPSILYFISVEITKPITELAVKMKNHRFDTQIAVPGGRKDEIYSLYTSYNTMQNIISSLINDVTEAAKTQKKIELKALQMQLTPHFLYNTFNSITAMARTYNANDIVKTVSALSSFFKHSLNNGSEITTIENEINHVISYVEIQKIRFGDKFELVFDIDKDVLNEKICKLTLQPLVENCIVHGFGHSDTHGIIKITANKSGNDIHICVADNGWGINVIDLNELNNYVEKSFDPDEPIEKYGIYNVNQRIKLYFGSKFGLSYTQNEPCGLAAHIHISTNPIDV